MFLCEAAPFSFFGVYLRPPPLLLPQLQRFFKRLLPFPPIPPLSQSMSELPRFPLFSRFSGEVMLPFFFICPPPSSIQAIEDKQHPMHGAPLSRFSPPFSIATIYIPFIIMRCKRPANCPLPEQHHAPSPLENQLLPLLGGAW